MRPDFRYLWPATLLWLFAADCPAAGPSAVARQESENGLLAAWRDDATLNAVQFVGVKNGWAVGDQGVIWRTSDAGATWTQQASPVSFPLRGVCFLTDRVGWVVGGGSVPYTKLSAGVVLFTNDGGETWQQLCKQELPDLHVVKFFTLDSGVAVGEPTVAFPTGVLTTSDGGRTWQPIHDAVGPPSAAGAGELQGGAAAPESSVQEPIPQAHWRAADFLNPQRGVVAGVRGRVSLVGDGGLIPPRVAQLGLRGLGAVDLQSKGDGWLVGDGGLVLRTDNQGLVWQTPPRLLPDAAREIFDFRAVCFRGARGWVAGAPGSVIWHTPDGGQSWQPHATRQPLPIAALCAPSDSDVWAVGAMGLMLHSTDGGETWTAVRGDRYRAAYWAVAAKPEQISLRLVTRLSGEFGYRGVVSLLARRDIGSDGVEAETQDSQLQEAVAALGGAAGIVDWQWPLDIPGLERNEGRLVAEWNRRAEGKLVPALLGHLVCQIRTWRPTAIVLPEPAADDDAVTNVLRGALLRAIEQAADATSYLGHQEHAALAPWKVERVFLKLKPGASGEVQIDPHEFLPRLGQTVEAASASAAGRLSLNVEAVPRRENFRLLRDDDAPRRASLQARPRSSNRGDGSRDDPEGTRLQADGKSSGEPGDSPDGSGSASSSKIVRDFFSGLSIRPGSDARRQLPSISDTDLQAKLELAKRQRNLDAYVDRFLRSPLHASQLVSQLRDVTKGMPDDQAALQLARLAQAYRDTGQWELAESTLVELVERFPHEPAARDGMRWLLQMWCGAEPAWRRARLSGVLQARTTTNADDVIARFNDLSGLEAGHDSQPIRQARGEGTLRLDTDREIRGSVVRNWQEQARHMADLLSRTNPGLFQSPEIQFPLAAALRQKQLVTEAEAIYHRQMQAGRQGPWPRSAAAELWTLHPVNLPDKPISICRRTPARPELDGVLADPCWQNAQELPLVADGETIRPDAPHAFCLLCFDEDYLYWAIACPQAESNVAPPSPALPPRGGEGEGETPRGRKHDMDLLPHDRVTLLLDVDRDYATWYRLSVDRRGCTAEDCWGDATWNPQWFVASAADNTGWRAEIAIPLRELVPQPPRQNTFWNASLFRTIPAVRVEGWTQPATTVPHLEHAGLLRFE